MNSRILPETALHEEEQPLTLLPACEHYAGNEKFILKAFQLQQSLSPPFDVTCDLEDGAPVGREEEHAQMVVDLIRSARPEGARVGVRVHSFDHDHFMQDLDTLMPGVGECLAYITVPKVADYRQAREIVESIEGSCKKYEIDRSIPLHFLIETHKALHEVWQIASLPNVEVLDFGIMDFISTHQGAIPASSMYSPGQFQHPLVVRAKLEIVAAALAHGSVPSHNVTVNFQDTTQLREDARRAYLEFGFLRMWSIHPSQIEPILEEFTPDFDLVQEAVEILLDAQSAAWGPIKRNEKLHDRASYRYFWALLKRARACGVALDNTVLERLFP